MTTHEGQTSDSIAQPTRTLTRRGFLRAMVASAGAAILAACGGGSPPAAPGGAVTAGASPGGAATTAPAASTSGGTTIEYWAWVEGSDAAAELWNSTHDNVKVNFTRSTAGTEHYNKVKAAVAAGAGGPDVAQVEFQLLTSLVVGGAIQPITQQAASAQSQFIDWTWQQVSLGGDVYAIPQDIGPMGMLYNKELLEQFEIAVPTTWGEFRAAAEKLHSADSSKYLAHFSPAQGSQFAAFPWQNGGKWFGINGDAWQVSINGPESKKVAEFWQDLIANDLVKIMNDFNAAWYQDLQNGVIATWITAVWGAGILTTNVADAAGKWAAAAMPQWSAGSMAAGNWGGSTTAVVTGSQHVPEAVEFAVWLNSDPGPLELMIKANNIFPATKAGGDLPTLNMESPYFGGQKINDIFKAAATNVDASWQWGPSMDQVFAELGDKFTEVTNGNGTLSDTLDAVQETTVADLRSRGLTVAG